MGAKSRIQQLSDPGKIEIRESEAGSSGAPDFERYFMLSRSWTSTRSESDI